MTQSQIGTIEAFDGEDFSYYSERLDSYLLVNNIGTAAPDANYTAEKRADQQKVAAAISDL